MPKLPLFTSKDELPKSKLWINEMHKQKLRFLFPSDRPKC